MDSRNRYSGYNGETDSDKGLRRPSGILDRNSSLEKGLQSLLAKKDVVKECSKCGCKRLKYTGLGKYECQNCANIDYNKYGRVRDYIELNGQSSILEIMESTGLTRNDIQMLVDSGSVTIVDGKVW